MISYKLALQLKEAGFPLKARPVGLDFFTDPATNIYEIPTLSELIEACGDGFTRLSYDSISKDWDAGKYWEGRRGDPEHWVVIESGSTPEEAVAKLWLKLNV